MEFEQLLTPEGLSAGAVILLCLILILKALLQAFACDKTKKRFAKFLPYALQSFSWVEKTVPDNYGKGKKDPAHARACHKMDLFCKRFIELSKEFLGKNPNKAMVAEAKRLAAVLAEKRKQK